MKKVLAEGEHERDGRGGHGPANAIGGERDHHAVIRASSHVDVVVPDAEPRHDAESVRALERRAREACRLLDQQGVVRREVVRGEFPGVARKGFPVDIRPALENVESEVECG